MDEIVYDSLTHYFSVLEKLGYYPYKDVKKLLVLLFYRHFCYEDYRGMITFRDYKLIERALYCLFGSSCLIPYPDYLKMGKLKLGNMTELVYRTFRLEERMDVAEQDIDDIEATKVVKALDDPGIEIPDIDTSGLEEKIDTADIDNIEIIKVVKALDDPGIEIPDIDTSCLEA